MPETVPDEFDAGVNGVAEGRGVREAIGMLVSCPICAGAWMASGLVYGLRIAPVPARFGAAILGVSGLAELLDAATETLSWSGQPARTQSGGRRKEIGTNRSQGASRARHGTGPILRTCTFTKNLVVCHGEPYLAR